MNLASTIRRTLLSAATLCSGLAGSPALAQLSADSISPNPVVVGQAATLRGRGFGERGSLELHLVRGDRRDGFGQITGRQVISWSDTRIEFTHPLTEEGPYYIDLVRRPEPSAGGDRGFGDVMTRGETASVRFDLVLPRASISSYQPSSVCPGGMLTIRGTGFTDHPGVFILRWEKIGDTRNYSISIREDRIADWSNNQIRFAVPTDLPAYISPGDRFRLVLGARQERGIRTVANGPAAQLSERCAGSEGAGASTRPLNSSQQRRELKFQVAPMDGRAKVGDQLVFGGTFDAGDILTKELRSRYAQVEWTIRRDDALVKTGLLDIKNRRTPWLQRVEAEQAGTYFVEMRVLTGGPSLYFRPDLSGARVVVVPVLRQKIDPRKLEKRPRSPLPQLKKTLPEGLEPMRR